MIWPRIRLGQALEAAPIFVDGDWVESKDQDPQGDVRLIQLADVGDGFYVDKSNRFLTSAAAERLKCTFLEPGDLLLARMPDPLGRACVFPGDSKRAVTVVDVCVIRVDKSRIDAQWLMHCINSPEVRSEIGGYVTGTTRSRISRGNLSKVEIHLPPLAEQRRIAAILDQADALRAKRREALAQLDSLTQSIFMEMFGDYRADGVPWPIRSVEDIAVDMTIGLVRSAAEFGPDCEVPYVRMNAIGQRGEFLPNLVMRTEVSEDEFERYALRAGDFLFNTRNSRELVGKTALFREPGRYVFNNNLMRIRFCDSVHPEYVAAAFQTPYVQQELEIRKAGTTSVFAIYARELKTVPIPVPPYALQQTFATRIQAVEALKTTHRAALAELDALFASLQHRAFSGGL